MSEYKMCFRLCSFYALIFACLFTDSIGLIGSADLPDAILMPAVVIDTFSSRFLHRNESTVLQCSIRNQLESHHQLSSKLFSPYRKPLALESVKKISVMWFRNGAQISDENGRLVDASVSERLHVEGYGNNSRLTFRTKGQSLPVLKSLAGKYYCAVQLEPFGTVTSLPINIVAAEIRKSTTVRTRDTVTKVHLGGNAFISCAVPQSEPSPPLIFFTQNDTDTPLPAFSLENGTMFYGQESRFVVSKNGLHIYKLRWEDAGVYRCGARNQLTNQVRFGRGETTIKIEEPVTEQVAKITFPVTKETVVNVAVGDSFVLECIVNGFPQGHVRWDRDTGLTLNSRIRQWAGNLLLQNVSLSDGGSYVCHAVNTGSPWIRTDDFENDDTSASAKSKRIPPHQQHPTSFAVYIVNIIDNVDTSISIGQSSMSMESVDGSVDNIDNVELVCEGKAATEVQWMYNGRVLPHAETNKLLGIRSMKMDHQGSDNPLYKLVLVQPLVSGVYQCISWNKFSGHAYSIFVSGKSVVAESSLSANLSNEMPENLIEEQFLPPKFSALGSSSTRAPYFIMADATQAPPVIRGAPENAIQFEGEMLILVCNAKRATKIVWLKDGQALQLDPRGNGRLHLLGSGSLNFRALEPTDEGLYTCVAMNNYGNASASASVKVDPKEWMGVESSSDSREWEPEFDPAPAGTTTTVAHMPSTTTTTPPPIVANHKTQKQKTFAMKNSRRKQNKDRQRNHDREEQEQDEEYEEDDNSSGSASTMDSIAAADLGTSTQSKTVGVRISAPEIIALSPSSALLNWKLAEDGSELAANDERVQFFKVQFKLARSKSDWKTLSDRLPSHVRSHSVPGLEPGGKYRFRIGAILSDNHHSIGQTSQKFTMPHLQHAYPAPGSIPHIIEFRALSPSAIRIAWEYPFDYYVPITGFTIFYRPFYSGTAADDVPYFNTTVIGSENREHVLDHLLPATPYEIKMTAFNVGGASAFSNKVQQTTKSDAGTAASPYGFLLLSTTQKSLITSIFNTQRNNVLSSTFPVSQKPTAAVRQTTKLFNLDTEVMLTILGCVLGVMVLILILSVAICTWYQRKQKKIEAASKGRFRDQAYRIHREYSFLRTNKCPVDLSKTPSFRQSAYLTEQTIMNGHLMSLVPNPLLNADENLVDGQQHLTRNICELTRADGTDTASEERQEGSVPECDRNSHLYEQRGSKPRRSRCDDSMSRNNGAALVRYPSSSGGSYCNNNSLRRSSLNWRRNAPHNGGGAALLHNTSSCSTASCDSSSGGKLNSLRSGCGFERTPTPVPASPAARPPHDGMGTWDRGFSVSRARGSGNGSEYGRCYAHNNTDGRPVFGTFQRSSQQPMSPNGCSPSATPRSLSISNTVLPSAASLRSLPHHQDMSSQYQGINGHRDSPQNFARDSPQNMTASSRHSSKQRNNSPNDSMYMPYNSLSTSACKKVSEDYYSGS